jgi:hypothetical protein
MSSPGQVTILYTLFVDALIFILIVIIINKKSKKIFNVFFIRFSFLFIISYKGKKKNDL